MLDAESANRLTENVIGVFSMPMGLGLNFQINTRDYLVPMVVEEPSIIAAVSSAAKLVRRDGGFTSVAEEPRLIGQVQVLDVAEPEAARAALLARAEDILELANSRHPNMVARGGGAKEVEVHLRALPRSTANSSSSTSSSTAGMRWARTWSTPCARRSRR